MAWLKLSKPKNKKDTVNGTTPHHDKVSKKGRVLKGIYVKRHIQTGKG